MKLSLITGALRDRCPFFSGRVSPRAAWKYLPSTLPALSAACVIPGEDAAAAQQTATDYWQTVTEDVAVAGGRDWGPSTNGEDKAFDSLGGGENQVREARWG